MLKATFVNSGVFQWVLFYICKVIFKSGCSVARYRASMGCLRSWVRIPPSRPDYQGLTILKSKSFFVGSNIGLTLSLAFCMVN